MELHILVSFIEEDGHPTAILPVKRVKDVAACDLEEGIVCKVEWSDKKLYSSQVLAIGEKCTVCWGLMYLHAFVLGAVVNAFFAILVFMCIFNIRYNSGAKRETGITYTGWK